MASPADPGPPLRPSVLLDAWEEGRGQGPVERALTLLRHGLPELDREALADLPVGRRDRLLLELRERRFGPVADCVVRCADCGETLQFPLRLATLAVAAPAESHGVVDWQGAPLRVRAATSRDLLALAGVGDQAAMTAALLQRCTARLDAAGTATPVPAEAAEAVAAEMARLDPGADLRLTLSCTGCGAEWTSLFDIGAYLWREVDAEARRLLVEVDALARAYSWSESEILRLSRARRQAYLELAGQA
jgi:hypothetical protein